MLRNMKDRQKLVNCQNDLGCSTILAAIKSVSMKTLHFLINQEEFDENQIFNTDQKGLSALHYSMLTKQIDIFKAVLAIYDRNDKGDFKLLIFSTTDNEGNNPFALAMKRNVILGNLEKWMLNQFGDDLDSKLKLLFAENKNKEVPLIASYQNNVPLNTAYDYIHEYFAKREVVNEEDALFAGRAMIFLARYPGTMSTMRKIFDSVVDATVLNKILSVRNSTNLDILYKLCAHNQPAQETGVVSA